MEHFTKSEAAAIDAAWRAVANVCACTNWSDGPAWPGAAERFGNTVVGETAERLRKALASRGLKLVEAGDAD